MLAVSVLYFSFVISAGTAAAFLLQAAGAAAYEFLGQRIRGRKEWQSPELVVGLMVVPVVSGFAGGVVSAGVNWATSMESLLSMDSLATLTLAAGAIGQGLVVLVGAGYACLLFMTRRNGLRHMRVAIREASSAGRQSQDVSEPDLERHARRMALLARTGARVAGIGRVLSVRGWIRRDWIFVHRLFVAGNAAALITASASLYWVLSGRVGVNATGKSVCLAVACLCALATLVTVLCGWICWRLYRRGAIRVGEELRTSAERAHASLAAELHVRRAVRARRDPVAREGAVSRLRGAGPPRLSEIGRDVKRWAAYRLLRHRGSGVSRSAGAAPER